MRFLDVGARTAWTYSDADEPEHCYKALNSLWMKVCSFFPEILKSCRGRGHGARDEQYSPHRSRSMSGSFYPGDDRNHHSTSPVHKKKHVPSRDFPSPGENGQTRDMPRRSWSPRRNSKSPAKSRFISYSPQ